MAAPSRGDNGGAIEPPPSSGPECGPEATYRWYSGLASLILALRVKEKRELFKRMRLAGAAMNEHAFFPGYGFTAGEFAVFHVLTENARKNRGVSVRRTDSNETPGRCRRKAEDDDEDESDDDDG